MTQDVRCNVSARWGPRRETPTALARRWLATIRRLQSIDPVFARWYKGVDGRGVELTLDVDAIETEIADNAGDDGYSFGAKSDRSGRGSRMFELDMRAGSNWMNVVSLGTDYYSVPDPSILTYRIFKASLLAVADNFGADRAFAYPTSLSALWPRPPNANPTFPIVWISYVSARRAHLVSAPSTAIVEHRPDGSMLMAATDATFDVANPAHMAVARDIEAAVAPLNGLPWIADGPVS